MARSRRALTLTTAIAALVVARAHGQPVPPTPASLPDPAAVLLAPVASTSDRDIRPVADSALPSDDPKPVRRPPAPPRDPAARIRFDDGETTPVRAVEYEESQRTSRSDPDSARRSADPYDYLTDGLLKRNRESRASWDNDTAASKDGNFFTRLRDKLTGRGDDPPAGDRLGDRIDEMLGGGRRVRNDDRRRWWESDRAFDCFISPVSNPFYAEDPRSLTEVRPIVIYQGIPKEQGLFQGGTAWFFGGQARLAFGERWSVVINKVGVQTFNPGGSSPLSRGTGLSELWIGPKVVLIRDPAFQTLVSAGATFQIPLGGGSVYQNTGKLSIVPYVTAAQKLMATSWGTFQGMATAGYSFGTTRDRSDFFYASAHLDFDVANLHRFYPLLELNWFSYTKNGQASSFGVEGRDLGNFGAAVSGSNTLSWAIGGRYKVPGGRWEFGAAYEGPLAGTKGLLGNRILVDLIWRF